MEENLQRKAILLSLAALLVGSLLFIFGISIQTSYIPLIMYYVIAMFLYGSAFLSIFNQYKKQKQSLYVYILILTIVIICVSTYAFISKFQIFFT